MKKLIWNGQTLTPRFLHYADSDRTAIQLVTEDGQPYATATVNMPEVPLEEGEVILKSYSENAGLREAMVDAGWVRDTGWRVQAGWAEVSVVVLLIAPGEQYD